VGSAEPFCTHLARLQFIFRQDSEWISEEDREEGYFSGKFPPGTEANSDLSLLFKKKKKVLFS
jgi:hypothetical protein